MSLNNYMYLEKLDHGRFRVSIRDMDEEEGDGEYEHHTFLSIEEALRWCKEYEEDVEYGLVLSDHFLEHEEELDI